MATPNDLYMALSHTVRGRLLERWLHTVENYPLDSLATLEIPAVGYGIRYEFGIPLRHPGETAS